MRTMCALLSLTLAVQSAAPDKGRELTATEKKEVARLERDIDRKVHAGEFEDAVKTAKRIADYRAERQGDSHWEVIDARLEVVTWQRPAKDCAEVIRSNKIATQGVRLLQDLRHREAEEKLRETLAIRQKVLGEQHPDTAKSYTTVANCLKALGKASEALPLSQKALTIYQKVFGEQHPDTAASYHNMAGCLKAQGRHAEALLLSRKALAIRKRVLGELHPDTAASYSSVAVSLSAQGKHVEALTLHRKGLTIYQTTFGEEHPDTASTYNVMAICLEAQGRHAEAIPLCKKALAINQKVLGEQHFHTANSYNNLASCLNARGKYAEALPLYQKALAISQKVWGEQHSDTAASYNNVAFCLGAQGKEAEALPLFQKGLAIFQTVLGEQHPSTASGYNNVAACLDNQGKNAEALTQYQKALTISQKVLGEQHPQTANRYRNMAFCLYSLGKYVEATRNFEAALLGYEFGRLKAADSGFDRSLFHADVLSPRVALAFCLLRQNQPLRAWEQAESDLARGLLDDLLRSTDAADDADKLPRLSQLDQALIPLLTREQLTDEETKHRDTLTKERDDLLAVMARLAAKRSRDRVLPLESIQTKSRPMPLSPSGSI